MEHTRCGEPVLRQTVQAGPVGPPFPAAAEKYSPPESRHPVAKYMKALDIARHRVVVEVALNDRLQPFTGLGHAIVHALAELLLNLSQLAPHALADRLAPHREVPFAVLPADVREAQEVERLRLAFSSSFPVWFGKPPELDPARFFWMQFQPKLLQPFPEVLPENGLLPPDAGNLGRYHPHSARRSRRLAPVSCATLHPEIERRSADRYSRVLAKSPPLAEYLSSSPTICRPPAPRPSAISGSAVGCAGRQRDAPRT